MRERLARVDECLAHQLQRSIERNGRFAIALKKIADFKFDDDDHVRELIETAKKALAEQ